MFRNIRTGAATLAALAAIGVGAAAIANAASDSGSTGATGATGSQGTRQQPPRPEALGHGPGETLLTDGTAEKVRQAALDKFPGATVLRVETDAQGSPYEAHLRKSDGSFVTVYVDKQFNVTGTESGFGPGGPRDGSPPG